jgi:hypothetical protein
MSHIQEPRLFEAVHRATSRYLQDGTAPTNVLYPGQHGLVRAVDANYLKDHFHRFDPKTVLGNLIVRDAGKDNNRFSGLAPGGKPSKYGGLYTSRHTAPMINEVWHYSGGKATNVARALSTKGVIRLHLVKPLVVLDVSRYSGYTTSFLRAIEADRDVKSALASSPLYSGAHLEQLMLLDDDYSVARGIGVAASESPFVAGLQAGTARPSDRPGETGDNVVLYGPDGQPVHHLVQAEAVTLFGYNGKTKEVEPQEHRVSLDRASQEYVLK